MRKLKCLALLSFLLIGIRSSSQEIQRSTQANVAPAVPKTWDDEAIATLEVPLANPVGSPKHVSPTYYYKIPVRPIYKQLSRLCSWP